MKLKFLNARVRLVIVIVGTVFYFDNAQAQIVSMQPAKIISVEKKDPAAIRLSLSSEKHSSEKEDQAGRIGKRQNNPLSSADAKENGQDDFAQKDFNSCPKPPKLGVNFEGNPETPFYLPPVGYYASESSIAISNAGKIVSISNGWIRYYDEKGTLLFSDSLYHFASALTDVHVQYDPKKDRFVFLAAYGVTDFVNIFSVEGVVLGFSKSNNPVDGWNFYYYPDSAIGDNNTEDYPQLGINDNEVFVTEFRTDADGNYVNSIILQLDKRAGYSGTATINMQIFSVPLSGVYAASVVPASGGSTSYGPNMYFVMGDETGSPDDLYYVFEVTNTIASGKAVLNTYGPVHSGETYFPAPLTYQPGHIPLLEQGTEYGGPGFDDFLQNAFFENGMLQFSQNSATNGRGAVCIGRITGIPNHLSCNSRTISDQQLTLLFPQIVYTGNSRYDNSVIVGIEYTGEKKYPGLEAVSVDSHFSVSQPTAVKQGEDTINGVWGDYSALCRRFNHPGECWMEGQYGSKIFPNINWIAKLKAPECADENLSVNNSTDLFSKNMAPQYSFSNYPNPFSQSTTISFTLLKPQKVSVAIYDVNGRLIKTLANSEMQPGTHQIIWNAKDWKQGDVASGIYFLKMQSANHSETRKLIIN